MRSAFLFGKLPAHGDFVSRGVAPEERDALDRWLSASLALAREELGERFDERYEAAPPWRFAWADAGAWTAGAMALSVDAVGRRYPIVAALGGRTSGAVEVTAAAIEGLLYAALQESWDADQLHVALTSAEADPLENWAGGEGWWTLGSDPFSEKHLIGSRPAGLMTAVLTPGEPDAQMTGGSVERDAGEIEWDRQDA